MKNKAVRSVSEFNTELKLKGLKVCEKTLEGLAGYYLKATQISGSS